MLGKGGMKEQGFEKSSPGGIFTRQREPQVESERPTVVRAPLDLLDSERSPRTLPKSSLHDALLEFEQGRDPAAAGAARPVPAAPEPPASEATTSDAELPEPTVLDVPCAPSTSATADGETDSSDERRPDGKLRRAATSSSTPDTPDTSDPRPPSWWRAGSSPLRGWREGSGLTSNYGFDEDDELGARLESDEISHIGQVIDNRYLVEALIARGGMGVVYRCRHQVIGKRFAVKIIRSNMAHLSDAPRRFLMEAKAASAIGNEHIIDIVDYGTLADGSAYLVMELLEGMPLSDLIARHETLPTRRIVSIGMQVCEGLRAAHEAGIVHRDLKPENIFLVSRRSGDFIKILDFGIAKMSMPGEPMTKKGLIVGTPHYMSPEQAAGLPVDPRGDIYSLGVILYELATGRVPFDATHYMAVLAKHMTAPPPPFDSLGLETKLPTQFEAVVQMCLAKRPEERFQSMADLHEALERLFRRLPPTAPLVRGQLPSVDLLSAPPPEPRETTRAAGPSLPAAAGRTLAPPPRRRDLELALGAAIVLGISLLSVWRMRSPESSGDERGAELRAPSSAAQSPGERPPPPSSTGALEPAPAWPAAPPAHEPEARPHRAEVPPGRLSEGPASPASPPAAPAPSDDGMAPVTIVELAPGKSVEIEARTRLSLRLAQESRALAEGHEPSGSAGAAATPDPIPSGARPAAPDEPATARRQNAARKPGAPRVRRYPRPELSPSGSDAPKENGLINPWPSPR